MSELDSIVRLTVSANSRTVTRKGFGTALVLGYHTLWPEHFRIYSDLSGLISDGFALSSPVYRKVAAAFSQNPAPQSVIVGRLPSAPSFTQTVTITSATAGQYIRCKVITPATGVVTQIERLIPGSSSTTAEATAVELLIEAVSGVDSTSTGAVITVTPTAAGQFPYIYDLENCTLEETTADAGYAAELASLQLLNDDWYFLSTDSSSSANVLAVAAWALTQKKVYVCTSASAGELSGSGTLGFTIKAAGNGRTTGVWAPDLHQCADTAWAGGIAALDPGTYTACFMALKGVSPKLPAITSTEKSNLETDNWNHYMTVAGVSIVRNGVLFDGEYIDLVVGTDALEARIQEDVFSLFANTRKVPMTDAGFVLIKNAILGAMKAFEGTDDAPGLLVKGTSKVVMPLASSISDADRAARKVNGIKFFADYAEAAQSAGIVGTLSI